MPDNVPDETATLLKLWLGDPQDRAQVMPRLAEMNRFVAVLCVVGMIEALRDAPAGDRSIPTLLDALEQSAWRYASP